MSLGASAPDGFVSFVGTPHSGDRAVISPGVATPSFPLTMKAPSSVDGASSGVGGYDGDEHGDNSVLSLREVVGSVEVDELDSNFSTCLRRKFSLHAAYGPHNGLR